LAPNDAEESLAWIAVDIVIVGAAISVVRVMATIVDAKAAGPANTINRPLGILGLVLGLLCLSIAATLGRMLGLMFLFNRQ
jgi:hypothetical protein